MDILGADFYNAVEQIKTRLGKNAICLQLPIGKEDEFKGIIDLFEMQAYIYNDEKGDDISVTDIPEEMKDEAELYHTELVEKICELDDDLMMEYLEGEEPSIDAMKAVLRKATCECTAVPVCCGTTDDEAVIIMVDSNLQRERVLPSEKAFAYKMKLDAMRRQAGRPSKENGVPLGHQRPHRLPGLPGGLRRELLRRLSVRRGGGPMVRRWYHRTPGSRRSL